MCVAMSMYMCVFLLLTGVLTDVQNPDLFNHTGLTEHAHYYHHYHNFTDTKLLLARMKTTAELLSEHNPIGTLLLIKKMLESKKLTKNQLLRLKILLMYMSRNPKFLKILHRQFRNHANSSGNATYSHNECIQIDNFEGFYTGFTYTLYISRSLPKYELIKQCVANVLDLKTTSFLSSKAYEAVTVPTHKLRAYNTSNLIFKLSNCGSSFVCAKSYSRSIALFKLYLLALGVIVLCVIAGLVAYYVINIVKERKKLREYMFKETETCFIANEDGTKPHELKKVKKNYEPVDYTENEQYEKIAS